MKNRSRKQRGDHFFQINVSRSPEVSRNSQLDDLVVEHFFSEALKNIANVPIFASPGTSLPRCVFNSPLRFLGIKLKKNVKPKKTNNHTPRSRSAKPNRTCLKLSSHDLEAQLAKMCLTPHQSKEVAKSKDLCSLPMPYNMRSPQTASQLEDTFAKLRLTPLSPQSGSDGNSQATGTLPGPF